MDEALLNQVLNMLQGSLIPEYLKAATEAMDQHKGNAAFLEYLSVVFAGATGSVPTHLCLDVRRVAGAVLKAHLNQALKLLTPDAVSRVKERVLGALGVAGLASQAASIVSALSTELSKDGDGQSSIDSLWPELCPTLLRTLSEILARGGGSAGTALGAISAVRMLSEDELFLCSPSVFDIVPCMVQWMACPDSSIRLEAARAAQSLVRETSECVSPPRPLALLQGYMDALSGIITLGSAPAITCVINSLTCLVENVSGVCWALLPSMMPFVLSSLAKGGREGFEEAALASADFFKTVALEAVEVDANAQWSVVKCGYSGPGRSVLLPHLPAILDSLLRGMELGETFLANLPRSEGGAGPEREKQSSREAANSANSPIAFRVLGVHGVSADKSGGDKGEEEGEEEDEEEGEGENFDEDFWGGPVSVRDSYRRTFVFIVDVYQSSLLDSFLPLLATKLATPGVVGGAPGGPPPWVQVEAGILALGILHPGLSQKHPFYEEEEEDEEEEGVSFLEQKLSQDVIPQVFGPLVGLLASGNPPDLRATAARTLSRFSRWIHSLERQQRSDSSSSSVILSLCNALSLCIMEGGSHERLTRLAAQAAHDLLSVDPFACPSGLRSLLTAHAYGLCTLGARP